MTKTKAVATTEPKNTAVAAFMTPGDSWGSEGIDTADILVPRLLLMQPTSELVGEGKAQPGDILRSTDKKVICKKGETLEFAAIMQFKEWIRLMKVGNKFEFKGKEPFTMANADAPLEWKEGDKEWRRDKALNFYVLLPDDIEREREALVALQEKGELPDPDDAMLPCVVQFKRTSFSAGKTLITHFAKASEFKVPPAVSTFKLGTKHEKNEQGQYYVFTVEKAGKTTPEELAACRRWYEVIARGKGNVKVDEDEEEIIVETTITASKTMNQNF